MKIISEIDIRNFEFWSGGKDRAVGVKSDDDWSIIESNLEDLYPDGMTDMELNDFFWFEFDTIAQWLGYESEEHYSCGAAKDADEMFDVIKEEFPEAEDEAVTEWCEDYWENCDVQNTCFSKFREWYDEWYRDNYGEDDEEEEETEED